MQASLIIKSNSRWYSVPVEFRALPDRMLPILEEFWSRQDAADVIVNTCGSGIKMAFQNLPKPIDASIFSMSGWYDGDQFDHSPDWSNTPVAPDKSKMVANDYFHGPIAVKESFDDKEQVLKSTNSTHLYIWDGESWSHQQNTVNPFARKNPWKRT